ncbi:MAG: lipoyl(octanoyl) transferase LipB [Anaerolineae bacterium]
MKRKELFWTYLGRADYQPILEAQRSLREAVIRGAAPGGLILVEHPPTITIGRHGRKKNVLTTPADLARLGFAVHEIERGGDVTYHGPGQLVGYPVLPVTGGVRRFMESLGDAARRVLADLGIEASWQDDRPGLWTAATPTAPGLPPRGQAKIAAVGLHISHGVAIHGIALNVDPDLSHYQHIVPCGLATAAVTSVRALTGRAPPLADMAERFAQAFTPPGSPTRPVGLAPAAFYAHQRQPPPAAL